MVHKIDNSIGDKIFDSFNVAFFSILSILMIYPLWNVFTTSIVTTGEFYSRPFFLWPKEPTLAAYHFILSSSKIISAFGVSIFITVVGTVYCIIITSMMAYGLSKKSLPGRNFFLIMITITMFFSGGLIPYFFLIRSLGLMNSIWVLILPLGINVWHFIVMKSFFGQIPASLEESARLDGANDLVILFKIVFPLSLPLLATFSLFTAVSIWNSWFDASIFIQNRKLHPLALVLRQMVVIVNGSGSIPVEMEMSFRRANEAAYGAQMFEDGIKMATVIVATAPLLFIYPWLQKYFAKGVIIGSIKG